MKTNIILCIIGWVLTITAVAGYFVGCGKWVCNSILLTSLTLAIINIIFYYKKVKKQK